MNKRICATTLIWNGHVANGYSFNSYLPVGQLKYVIPRLEEWQLDEIIILNCTHSFDSVKDFQEIVSDARLDFLSTPLSYGGGISELRSVINIISAGAERVVLCARNLKNSKLLIDIRQTVGDQAVLIHYVLNHNGIKNLSDETQKFNQFLNILPSEWGGEILITDSLMDGGRLPRVELLSRFALMANPIGVVVSGGFSLDSDIADAIRDQNISGVAIGNQLHRCENPISKIKEMNELQIRKFETVK